MTLSKEESTNIKGLLILLIVIGHNHVLAPQGSFLMDWLYCFHVLVFFILPFFYNYRSKKISTEYMIDLIIRNWVPYFFTTFIALTASVIFNKNFEVNKMIIFAFFNGSTSMTSQYLGAIFLWFLPTYCTFNLLLVVAHQYKLIKIIGLLAGGICWLLTWDQFEWLKLHSLFGIPMAIKCFSLGCMCQWIFQRRYIPYIGAVVFMILTVLFYKQRTITFSTIIWPISAFGFILTIQRILNNRLFQILGKYSLIIYLIHVFIYQFIEHIARQNLISGIFNLILTLIISILIAFTIERNEFIRKLYTPRNKKEFKSNCKLSKK